MNRWHIFVCMIPVAIALALVPALSLLNNRLFVAGSLAAVMVACFAMHIIMMLRGSHGH